MTAIGVEYSENTEFMPKIQVLHTGKEKECLKTRKSLHFGYIPKHWKM